MALYTLLYRDKKYSLVYLNTAKIITKSMEELHKELICLYVILTLRPAQSLY